MKSAGIRIRFSAAATERLRRTASAVTRTLGFRVSRSAVVRALVSLMEERLPLDDVRALTALFDLDTVKRGRGDRVARVRTGATLTTPRRARARVARLMQQPVEAEEARRTVRGVLGVVADALDAVKGAQNLSSALRGILKADEQLYLPRSR